MAAVTADLDGESADLHSPAAAAPLGRSSEPVCEAWRYTVVLTVPVGSAGFLTDGR